MNFSPKNYQLWYHRRALLEIRFGAEEGDALLKVAKKELDYVAKILNDDSKNYHVSML
jgi:protein farnesyltransferase/geranylgeranyltransferase type-1 subunit alpha